MSAPPLTVEGEIACGCGHAPKWHHDERGCDYSGPTKERGCPCDLSSDRAIWRIINREVDAALRVQAAKP